MGVFLRARYPCRTVLATQWASQISPFIFLVLNRNCLVQRYRINRHFDQISDQYFKQISGRKSPLKPTAIGPSYGGERVLDLEGIMLSKKSRSSVVLVLPSSVTALVKSLRGSLNGRGSQFDRKSGLSMCFALQKWCYYLDKTGLLLHKWCPHFIKRRPPLDKRCFALHTRGDPKPSTSNPKTPKGDSYLAGFVEGIRDAVDVQRLHARERLLY